MHLHYSSVASVHLEVCTMSDSEIEAVSGDHPGWSTFSSLHRAETQHTITIISGCTILSVKFFWLM